MDLFADLSWRGLVHQCTHPEQIGGWLAAEPRTLYAGFDPTSDSLHVGSLLPALMLRRFQRAGHRPIALVGGATGMIGDPSGKSEERPLLSVEELEKNVRGIERQLRRLLDFDAPRGAILVNNLAWMAEYSYLHFLRDVGKHVPLSVMLSKESVQARLARDSGISYTEFSYMLLQAYDFVVLHQRYGCQLQIGGSDQWGNITAGIDLARRMHGVQLFGLTCPLLLKSDGSKMGKTERGAIYLAPEKTSPYAFYQYWINVADDDAGRCLRMLTELPREEIEQLDRARQERPHLRESQKRLAEELTRLVHGEEALAAAQRASAILFGAEIDNLTDQQLAEIFAEVPSRTLPRARLEGSGLPLVEALVEAGLARSKSEARRIIAQGGAYVNNRPCRDAEAVLTAADLAGQTTLVLRSGKKHYALLRFV
jgi:tyrosyl-tRNA synthetase